MYAEPWTQNKGTVQPLRMAETNECTGPLEQSPTSCELECTSTRTPLFCSNERSAQSAHATTLLRRCPGVRTWEALRLMTYEELLVYDTQTICIHQRRPVWIHQYMSLRFMFFL